MTIFLIFRFLVSFINIPYAMQKSIIELWIACYHTMKWRNACSTGNKKKFIGLNLVTIQNKVAKGPFNFQLITRFHSFQFTRNIAVIYFFY